MSIEENRATPPGALLVVQSGISDPAPVALEDALHILGRLPAADIGFDNPFVSRRHAEISYSSSGYSVRDLGSKNGTFVDGVRIGGRYRILQGGELIELGAGQVVMTFALTTATVTLPGGEATAAHTPSLSRAGGTGKTGGLFLDAAKREVYLHGEPVVPPLSKKEFDVLSLLFERGGQACSKDEIALRGWPERPEGAVSDQEIGQCVHRIRKRVEHDPGTPRYVELVRGYGYRLNACG